MQHNPRFLAAASLAAFLSLSACGEPETITANERYDPQAEELAKAKPIEAVPMIQASRTFRCKDNSLLYADYYTNNTARVSKSKGGEATVLTAAEGKPPYVAEGYSLSANGSQVTYTAPGKGTQTCKA